MEMQLMCPSHSNTSAPPMRDRSQPARADVLGHERLHVVDDALSRIVLGGVRDGRTDSQQFAALTGHLATRLIWQACADLPLRTTSVPGFSGNPINVDEADERIAGVLILRAGLLFAPAFRALLPTAPLRQIGLRRDEDVLEARQYTSNLPTTAGWTDHVLLLEPMLATGGSARTAIRLLREHHAGRITLLSLIGAPLGVATVLEADPQVRIIVCALDDALNAQGYIVPGLGDAGDRLFGTD